MNYRTTGYGTKRFAAGVEDIVDHFIRRSEVARMVFDDSRLTRVLDGPRGAAMDMESFEALESAVRCDRVFSNDQITPSAADLPDVLQMEFDSEWARPRLPATKAA